LGLNASTTLSAGDDICRSNGPKAADRVAQLSASVSDLDRSHRTSASVAMIEGALCVPAWTSAVEQVATFNGNPLRLNVIRRIGTFECLTMTVSL
jgi:hypothetical protein